MAEGQQDRTEQHRLALADELVGQIAANNRSDINERGVGAVDDVGFLFRKHPVLNEVEDQQRSHAVVGEALPHLRHEEQEQSLGVSDNLFLRASDQEQAAKQEPGERDHRDPESPKLEQRVKCENEIVGFHRAMPLPKIFLLRNIVCDPSANGGAH